MAGPAGGVLVLDVWETDAGDRDPLLLDWMQGWAMSLLEENYNAANISQRITDQESPTQS